MSSRVTPSSSSGCSISLQTPVPASIMIAASRWRSSAQAVWRSWAGSQPPPPRILSIVYVRPAARLAYGEPSSPGDRDREGTGPRLARGARLALAPLADAVPAVNGGHVEPRHRGMAAASSAVGEVARCDAVRPAGSTSEAYDAVKWCPGHQRSAITTIQT